MKALKNAAYLNNEKIVRRADLHRMTDSVTNSKYSDRLFQAGVKNLEKHGEIVIGKIGRSQTYIALKENEKELHAHVAWKQKAIPGELSPLHANNIARGCMKLLNVYEIDGVTMRLDYVQYALQHLQAYDAIIFKMPLMQILQYIPEKINELQNNENSLGQILSFICTVYALIERANIIDRNHLLLLIDEMVHHTHRAEPKSIQELLDNHIKVEEKEYDGYHVFELQVEPFTIELSEDEPSQLRQKAQEIKSTLSTAFEETMEFSQLIQLFQARFHEEQKFYRELRALVLRLLEHRDLMGHCDICLTRQPASNKRACVKDPLRANLESRS